MSEMAESRPMPTDFVRGDATGLAIPAHPEALRRGGEAFLTAAFRAFGALAPDNEIRRITRFEPCPGGSTGQKIFLSVEYARPSAALHTDLFVKFSRDFTDEVRDDRGKYEMEGEIRLGALSRQPAFAVHVPSVYFADAHGPTHTGLLISERIAFGQGGIAPHCPKSLDHRLADPAAHYRVIMRALAGLSAAHKAGRLEQIDRLFPYDAEAAIAAHPRPHAGAALQARLAEFASFVARAPQLFPASLADPGFFVRLAGEAAHFAAHEAAIRRFLQSDPAFIALCHWNANIDNAWFWSDGEGRLRCGLMDWGRAGQMNMAFALWGCLSAANLEIWNGHLDELLTIFVSELHAQGGPALAVEELLLHLKLHVGMMGLSYFIDSPARILHRLPQALDAAGPRDAMFEQSETARNQLLIATVFLNLWQRRDIPAALQTMLAR